MRCRPYIHLSTDVPFWVSQSSFLQHFDQIDFGRRDVLNVIDAYLEDWFCADANGARCFMVPPVSVYSRRTQFISGRHRTAVLLKHLDRVPLSFDMRYISDPDRTWMESIVAARIDTHSVIELPDLPIHSSLP